MSVFVYNVASSYHGVMIYIPIDSVGCAVTISNKGVIPCFLCSNALAFFRSWLIQRLSASFVVSFAKKIKMIS